MNLRTKNHSKGFTIIEVVLVLAIAGLIFLMVFIALPALQRSRADQQRRGDLGRTLTALQSYMTNNRNRLPADDEWEQFATDYLRANNTQFADPARGDYQFNVTPDDLPTDYDATTAEIFIATGRVCDGEGVTTAGTQKAAFRMRLEGGGVACVSND